MRLRDMIQSHQFNRTGQLRVRHRAVTATVRPRSSRGAKRRDPTTPTSRWLRSVQKCPAHQQSEDDQLISCPVAVGLVS